MKWPREKEDWINKGTTKQEKLDRWLYNRRDKKMKAEAKKESQEGGVPRAAETGGPNRIINSTHMKII